MDLMALLGEGIVQGLVLGVVFGLLLKLATKAVKTFLFFSSSGSKHVTSSSSTGID